ncbi:DUF2478 domain-containing protein [Candidatus Bipolaricaulota bacterium]|nr:DUF2478 domain-containing protein [Candidatus Bipolaricaulota bacterium]
MSDRLLQAVLDRLQFPQGSAAGFSPNRSTASRPATPKLGEKAGRARVTGIGAGREVRDTAILVTGGISEGKTSAVRFLADELLRSGIGVGGILAARIQDRNGLRTVGYDLEIIGSGKRIPLAAEAPPGQQVGRFFLRVNALQEAKTVLRRAAISKAVVILDEVGRLELSGQGHAAALESVLVGSALPVLVVRRPFVEAIRNRFGLLNADCYDVRKDCF